jgi:hypothetical protein
VKVDAKTIGLGWNFGGFFHWPVDVAIGVNASNSNVDFKQDISNVPANVSVDSKTRVLWLGVSKVFPIVTPYAKFGTAKQDSVVETTAGTIYGYTPHSKDDASKTGGYLALGANFQLWLIKLGFEWSQTMDVRRATGKLSFDF